MVTLSELQIKEIINVNDGNRLGHFTDLDIDPNSGKINALIVPVKEKQGGFFSKADELVIHWNQIETIGADVILVKNLEALPFFPDQQYMEKH